MRSAARVAIRTADRIEQGDADSGAQSEPRTGFEGSKQEEVAHRRNVTISEQSTRDAAAVECIHAGEVPSYPRCGNAPARPINESESKNSMRTLLTARIFEELLLPGAAV
jgi:hypothetical protein